MLYAGKLKTVAVYANAILGTLNGRTSLRNGAAIDFMPHAPGFPSSGVSSSEPR